MSELDRHILTEQLAELISFETVSPKATEFNLKQIELALEYITETTTENTDLFIQEIDNEGSLSLIISTHETNEPDIGLIAHVDVVPGGQELFRLTEDETNFYGRGVADMKFAIPVFMGLMRHADKNPNSPSIAMIITSDEEIGSSRGARHLAEDLEFSPKLLFVPDGGHNWQIVERAKAAIHVLAKFSGEHAHASRPWEGISAIDPLIEYLYKMRQLYPHIPEKDWHATTMNIGKLIGGQAGNQVANSAETLLDFRFSEPELRQEIINIATQHLPQDGEITIPAEAYYFDIDLNHPHIDQFINILQKITGVTVTPRNDFGATDARFFNQYGTPCIVSMPNSGLIHKDGEWIEIQGILDYEKALLQFCNSFQPI